MEVIKKILRLEKMLSICLFFWTSEFKYAYKLYAYKKRVYAFHMWMTWKWNDIIDCYFLIDLATAYRAESSSDKRAVPVWHLGTKSEIYLLIIFFKINFYEYVL